MSELGDEKEFEDYLNEDTDGEGGEENEAQFSYIMNTIKYKIDSISDLYNITLTNYLKLSDTDPIKPKLKEYLEKLIDQSLQAINQFDYALIDDEEDND